MRLIDADALIKRINTLYEWCQDERKSGLEQAMGIVYEQPTVYDECARKGTVEIAVESIKKQIPMKLVDYKNNSIKPIGYTCPRCKAFYSLYGQFIDSNYCPNCGQRVYVEGDKDDSI